MQDPAPAQEVEEVYGPDEGGFLLSLNGAFIDSAFDRGPDLRTYQIASGLSYFVNRTHEVGMELAFQKTEFPDSEDVGEDSDALNVVLFYNYNFRSTTRTSFFLGPLVIFADQDTGVADDSTTLYGAHVGMRHWLNPSTAITVEPRYVTGEFDDDLGGDTDQLFVIFGLSVTL